MLFFRYGPECFQHASHWRKTGDAKGLGLYKTGRFVECPKPGHHSCIDQIRGDGDIHFHIDNLEP